MNPPHELPRHTAPPLGPPRPEVLYQAHESVPTRGLKASALREATLEKVDRWSLVWG